MTVTTPLEPDAYYHVYNRGTNRESVFVEDRNYRDFLRLYARYVEPVADTFAYCLLRNHFHFLIRVKPLSGNHETGRPLSASKQLGHLCNAYAKAINTGYGRTGSLFQHPFGRIRVDSEAYFALLVAYIHQNPEKHGFVDDFRTWPYSSFHALVSAGPTRLLRGEVLGWFGGVEQFLQFHQATSVARDIGHLTSDDLT